MSDDITFGKVLKWGLFGVVGLTAVGTAGTDDMINRPDRWSGLDDGWLAVAWMPVPKIPESYP